MKTQLLSLLTSLFVLVPSIRTVGQTPASPILFTPPPPPYVGEPSGRGQGGGTRSPDCDRYEEVTALVPIVQVGERSIHWGLTTLAQPTVWVSAPNGLAEGTPIEFVMRNDSGQIVDRSVQVTVAVAPGSVSFTPAAPLQIGETYRWIVSITCDAAMPDVPVRVEGYIQRVAAPATLEAAPVDPLQQAVIYASVGIWYDALAVLGDRPDRSPMIAAAWSSLLEQINLDQLPNTPIGSCCHPEPQPND